MLWTLATLLTACSTPEPVVEPPQPPTAAPGRIGGSPILRDPVVIGAIAEQDVERVMNGLGAAFQACWSEAGEPQLKGKVLLKFSIDAAGAVGNVRTLSTSLRRPAIEGCVKNAVGTGTFPGLTSGDRAIVTWPVALPVEPS